MIGRKPKPPLHGRDHRPGGADPIPLTHMWPTYYDVPLWHYGIGNFSEKWTFPSWTIDNLCLNNGYTDAELDDEALFRLRLGPQYSLWAIGILGVRDIDGGQITMSLATDSDDCQDFPDEHPEPRGLMNEEPYDFALSGWDEFLDIASPTPETGTYLPFDFYHVGGRLENESIIGPVVFRIGGAPGARFTAWDSFFGPLGESSYAVANGGPGMWAIKMKVSGQNEGSSGSHCRISSLVVARISPYTLDAIGKV